MTGEYWCEHAWLGDRMAHEVLVREDGGVITSVAENTGPTPAGAVRLTGLVVPGLANAHSHAFHRALRGRSQRARGAFGTWRTLMHRAAERLDPDSYRELATACYAEMALAGVTRVGEFHYLHHAPGGQRYADPNAMGLALVDAARAAGVRLTLLDCCYLTADVGTPLQGVGRRFGDGDVHRWAQRVEDLAAACRDRPDVLVGAAVHSVRTVPADQLPVAAAWSGQRAAPLHVHLSQQPAENAECLAAYGRSPARVLCDAGALGVLTTVVHATHLDGHDHGLLTDSRTGACLCPTTERDLADGVSASRRLASVDAPFCLGSASHAVIDLLEEARAVELDERLVSGERGVFSAAELLGYATWNGHRALGDDDAGVITPGAVADLVALDACSPRTAGCGATAETVVFAASATDVTDVVTAGRHVVRARQHTLVPDVPGLLARVVAALHD